MKSQETMSDIIVLSDLLWSQNSSEVFKQVMSSLYFPLYDNA